MPRKLNMQFNIYTFLNYTAILFFALLCLLPFILVVSGSFSNELAILKKGFSLWPREFDAYSYEYLFLDIGKLLNGYKVTSIVTFGGTAISLLMITLMAYPISRQDFKYRNLFSFFAFFTLLFNGGMVTWYIVCTRYLYLKDNIWALMLPYAMNAWNMFLMRNFFMTIPAAMHESAKIDGAGELRTFFQIIVPLSVPGLVTVGLFTALGYWNDWWLGLMLINVNKLTPLQMLLRRIISNIQFFSAPPPGMQHQKILPAEGIKMATCVLTIGPIVILYPYVQRYFIKGIMVGSIKG